MALKAVGLKDVTAFIHLISKGYNPANKNQNALYKSLAYCNFSEALVEFLITNYPVMVDKDHVVDNDSKGTPRELISALRSEDPHDARVRFFDYVLNKQKQ